MTEYIPGWLINYIRTFCVIFVVVYSTVALYKLVRKTATVHDILLDLWLLTKAITATILVVYGVVVSYWLLYPYNTIDVDPIVIVNPNKTVKQGGVLHYRITYDKHDSVPGIIHRQLVGAFTVLYADTPGMNEAGKGSIVTPLPIPAYAEPGKYRLLWRSDYPVNPMRHDYDIVWSDEFEIVADPNRSKGEKGDTGAPGEDGLDGRPGKEGKQGLPGMPGVKDKKGSGFWPSISLNRNCNNVPPIDLSGGLGDG
jgi:hypothetical protein